MALKTNYKDDILNTLINRKRKYTREVNNDGSESFTDITEYSQVGDQFGASDINQTNAAINQLNNDLTELSNRDIYTTTEKVIGTWIDGRPIYRKTYNKSVSLTGSSITLDSISDLDVLLNVYGSIMRTSTNEIFPLPRANQSNSIGVEIDSSKDIKLTTSYNFGTNLPCILTFEYLKSI